MDQTCRYCRRPAREKCRFCDRPVCPKHAYAEPIKRRGKLAEDQTRVTGVKVMCKRDCFR